MPDEKGLLIIFSGPSGAGKDTVLSQLLQGANGRIKRSVSATTREPRKGERDGVDYHFITRDSFLRLIDQGEMLEYAQYVDQYYGTPRGPVMDGLAQGVDMILKIEVNGGAQVKKRIPDCVSIFVLPPSVLELERRLRARKTDDEAAVQKRMETAMQEILCAQEYDYIVMNDNVDEAISVIRHIISAEKHRCKRMCPIIKEVLEHAQTK